MNNNHIIINYEWRNSKKDIQKKIVKVSFDLPITLKKISLKNEDRKNLKEIIENINLSPKKMSEHLLDLLKKHPNEPIILNYLSIAYKILGNRNKTRIVLDEAIKRFPNDIYIASSYGLFYLEEGSNEKLLETFKSCILGRCYPKRKVFHFTEVVAFHDLWGRYFEKIGKIKTAKSHNEIVNRLLVFANSSQDQ